MSDAASMLVGTSAVMEEVRALVRQAALSMEPVLLVGGIGTGKHLAARTIHALSARSAAPFVRVNCCGLSDELLEAELRGWERGAFSGPGKRGLVEQAAGGALFLAYVDYLSPSSQLKVHLLLQEKQYSHLGSTERLNADVRVLASSTRSLPELVKAGTFREDLYAGLSALQIELPRLRDRPEDLELLVRHFLSNFGPTYGHQKATVTPGALALLASVPMVGNVRDLENYIEILSLKAPPGDIVLDEATVEVFFSPPARPTPEPGIEADPQMVEEALEKADGNHSVAARILGISRRTLVSKLVEFGLAPRRGGSDGRK